MHVYLPAHGGDFIFLMLESKTLILQLLLLSWATRETLGELLVNSSYSKS